MNRAVKFSLILACLFTGLANASFANIVQDPNASTLTGTVSGTTQTLGDWHVSGTGKAVGATATAGSFTGISNGSFTLTVTPNFTGGTTTWPATGAYTVSVTYTNFAHDTLAIDVNGVAQTGTQVGGTLTATVNIASPSDALTFVFAGSGNGNNFAITSVSVSSNAPEPKSIGAAALLLGLVGCTERRRLGGLMNWISRRFARLFS